MDTHATNKKVTPAVRNDPSLVARRRALRSMQTKAEHALWRFLRDRRAGGLKFRRQYSIGPFVVDFCCPAACIAVELDGWSHDGESAEERDRSRSAYLEAAGYRVLRYANDQVLQDAEAVSVHIAMEASKRLRSGDKA